MAVQYVRTNKILIMHHDPDQPALLERLAALNKRPIGPADRCRAARHLLDWMACRAAASRLPEAAAFGRALHPDRPSTAAPSLLCTATPELEAVLVDGALGCLLEMDDVHRSAVLHPGPVVIPAALAAARCAKAGVNRLLEAIVHGYEIMIRMGRATGLEHYRHWHPTSTCGAFGAAAAAAYALDLDFEQTVWSLANAGSRTGGLWQMRHEAVPTKALHTALTAQSGWLTARLAAHGFSGPRHLLEGEQGFFAATAPHADSQRLLAEDGEWLMHEVSFKPWPACRHAHPAMDALLALESRPEPGEIERIDVTTYAAAIDFCDNPEPSTPGEARFSIQHALASIVVRGTPRLAHYRAESLTDRNISALRRRVHLAVDPAYDQAFPAHFGAGVDVYLSNGTRLHAAVDDAWGDPERPLKDADLAAKSRDLLEAAGLSGDRAARLIDQTLALAGQDHIPAVQALSEAWR